MVLEDPAPMDARSKRREATRRQLEQQLKERQAREARRKRATLIASIVGTVVVVALVVVLVVTLSGGSNDKKPAAAASTSASPSASASSSAAATVPVPTAACSTAPKGNVATFAGLTITGTSNLKKAPVVTGKAAGAAPTTVRCEDLVVGTGKAATTASQATVEYVGLVYKTGKVFQSSWTTTAATFGLTAGPSGVITGFSQGIAGAGKIAPMRVGGRRVILMPAAAAYGASPPSGSGIPANADLVFVVDLQKLS